jgi:hypothetical protein
LTTLSSEGETGVSRIIHTKGTPTTQRNRLRRGVAEALRRLLQKQEFDAESKDLTAFIVFSLREINNNINSSAEAWEKRDYYIKADRFRRQWEWLGPMGRLISFALLYKQWDDLPALFVQLLMQFQDITVNKFTRKKELWDGAYSRLLSEEAKK